VLRLITTFLRRSAAKEAMNLLDADGAACYGLNNGCNYFVGSAVGIHSVQSVAMTNADQMRKRASRLLAMALNARDKGQIEYADELAKVASDVLDEATAAEASAILPAEEPQPAAQQQQQQQQPQRKKE
jgi:hypothetical protein